MAQKKLGLKIAEILISNNFEQINKGSIVENFVGLELLKNKLPFEQMSLYYWY